MMLEAAGVLGILAALMTFVIMRSNTHREHAWQGLVERIVEEHREAMSQAMTMMKASTVEQAVHAETLKKSHDIQLKAMEDTVAEIQAEEKDKDSSPYKIHTADGRELDLREWEIVG